MCHLRRPCSTRVRRGLRGTAFQRRADGCAMPTPRGGSAHPACRAWMGPGLPRASAKEWPHCDSSGQRQRHQLAAQQAQAHAAPRRSRAAPLRCDSFPDANPRISRLAGWKLLEQQRTDLLAFDHHRAWPATRPTHEGGLRPVLRAPSRLRGLPPTPTPRVRRRSGATSIRGWATAAAASAWRTQTARPMRSSRSGSQTPAIRATWTRCSSPCLPCHRLPSTPC